MPDECSSQCGDGIKASNEECDDGNSVSDDGCSQDCAMETIKFSCLPSPCKQTICQELTAITQCDDVAALQVQQTDSGLSETSWSHPALVIVALFQMQCDYSIDGSSASIMQNISVNSCSDFICREQQDNLIPGMSLTCSIRALCVPFGWSKWKVNSILVVGVPSPPLDPTIKQSSTMDSCKTIWTIGWSDPSDHGDKRPVGSLERAPVMGFEVNIQCGSADMTITVGQVFFLSLQALWDCDDGSDGCNEESVAMGFIMRAPEYSSQSLSCQRGDVITAQARARNVLFYGDFSVSVSLQAMGFPTKVMELHVVELPGILNVIWTQVYMLTTQKQAGRHESARIHMRKRRLKHRRACKYSDRCTRYAPAHVEQKYNLSFVNGSLMTPASESTLSWLPSLTKSSPPCARTSIK